MRLSTKGGQEATRPSLQITDANLFNFYKHSFSPSGYAPSRHRRTRSHSAIPPYVIPKPSFYLASIASFSKTGIRDPVTIPIPLRISIKTITTDPESPVRLFTCLWHGGGSSG